MPSFTVHTITANDWQNYKSLRLQSLQDSPSAFGSTYSEEATRSDDEWKSRLQSALASQRAQIFFVMLEDQACGLVWCKYLKDAKPTVVLYQMWVAPQSRRLGAGSALLKAAINWAKSKGAQSLMLEVATTEAAAIALYQRHGFTATGEILPLREDSDLKMQVMLLRIA